MALRIQISCARLLASGSKSLRLLGAILSLFQPLPGKLLMHLFMRLFDQPVRGHMETSANVPCQEWLTNNDKLTPDPQILALNLD